MKPLSTVTESLFQNAIRSVTARVNNVDGINLGQGICDMPTPQPIKQGAKKAIDNDKSIYAPFGGIAPLKDHIFRKTKTFNRLPLDGPEKDPDYSRINRCFCYCYFYPARSGRRSNPF